VDFTCSPYPDVLYFLFDLLIGPRHEASSFRIYEYYILSISAYFSLMIAKHVGRSSWHRRAEICLWWQTAKHGGITQPSNRCACCILIHNTTHRPTASINARQPSNAVATPHSMSGRRKNALHSADNILIISMRDHPNGRWSAHAVAAAADVAATGCRRITISVASSSAR